MKRPQHGSTTKQYAYAMRRLSGAGRTKEEMARLAGFSPSVAKNAKNKIEKTEGYKNAIAELARGSNNLLLAVINEFEVRGLKGMENKELISALNAITNAWDKIETRRAPDKIKTAEGNPLRAILTKRVETQTAVFEPVPDKQEDAPVVRDAEIVDDPMDF